MSALQVRWALRPEVALDQIRHDPYAGDAHPPTRPPPLRAARQAALPHQPLNALVPDPDRVLEPRLAVDPRDPCVPFDFE